uniref:Metalloendopeptidase n=1 Tax=Romanomermis culicivorax TaxID=13658 RepID=A0A915I490_ROMCU
MSACGYAYVGYQPKSVNAININFKSKICAPLIKAVIAHEGMHVFGFMHEHTRYDRDQFITVNWTNVDPQAVDIFTKDDPTEVNPFCVPYDYESIMHYDSYVGAKNYNYPAFWAKTNASYYLNRIGNYPTPSKNDILMMNKLYCLNSSNANVVYESADDDDDDDSTPNEEMLGGIASDNEQQHQTSKKYRHRRTTIASTVPASSKSIENGKLHRRQKNLKQRFINLLKRFKVAEE